MTRPDQLSYAAADEFRSTSARNECYLSGVNHLDLDAEGPAAPLGQPAGVVLDDGVGQQGFRHLVRLLDRRLRVSQAIENGMLLGPKALVGQALSSCAALAFARPMR